MLLALKYMQLKNLFFRRPVAFLEGEKMHKKSQKLEKNGREERLYLKNPDNFEIPIHQIY